MNPNWDTPEGQIVGANKLLSRWHSTTLNKDGDPNTIILKATLPDPQDEFRLKIVGAAIWIQVSFVNGHGDPPTDSPAELADLDPKERRFASQMYRSLWKRRVSLAREKVGTESPAVFILDICAVDPAFQRRGVAGKLVAWGLEEAKRRGGLQCMTEASVMGRSLYKKLGFGVDGGGERGNIVYEVDEEFRDRDMPEIVVMHTWAS